MSPVLQRYYYSPDAEAIGRTLEVIASSIGQVWDETKLKLCFSLMDLTTLKPTDTPQSVAKLVAKVNALGAEYPSYPLPASVCVYPNFASVVHSGLASSPVHTTCTCGAFPSSQSFLEVKCLECKLAVEAGADEIDVVLALNSFLSGDFEAASAEIVAMRKTIDEAAHGRKVILKVILETGLLISAERIAEASFIAMESGADFIKTSTGKVDLNATPMAAYVMCECIQRYYKATGRKVGFKAAGGISSAQDAKVYYSIVSVVLGEEWLNPGLFRFGVSRLGNNLMSEIEKTSVSYF